MNKKELLDLLNDHEVAAKIVDICVKSEHVKTEV